MYSQVAEKTRQSQGSGQQVEVRPVLQLPGSPGKHDQAAGPHRYGWYGVAPLEREELRRVGHDHNKDHAWW